MKIKSFQLNEHAKPLVNQRHFSPVLNGQIESIESGNFDKQSGLYVTHKSQGRFFVPMTSISWVAVEPEEVKKPVRRRTGAKKSVPAEMTA